jgi:hypothetical protein
MIKPTEPANEETKFTFRDLSKCFYMLLSKIPKSVWNSPNGLVQLPPATMIVSREQLDKMPDNIPDKVQIDIDDNGIMKISIKKKRKRGQIFKPRRKLILPN